MKSDECVILPHHGILHRKHAVFAENGRKKLIVHSHQLQLLCAFLLGFLMAFSTLIFYDRYLVWSIKIEQHSTNTELYQTGYMNAMKKLENEDISLNEKLTKSVRVLCMVLTYPKSHHTRAIHVKKTWGKRCTKLLFMSSEVDEELGSIAVVEHSADVYGQLWNKTRESFRYAYENYLDEYDWFLKADDDTYVIVENLRYMLYAYQPDIPIYFGYEMKLDNVSYMSGGASYVLSREALKLFMKKSYDDDKLCPSATHLNGEDFSMGVCLQNAGVLAANSVYAAEEDKKAKFFPIGLLGYTEPEWNLTLPDWLFKMSTAPVETGLECCSNYTITFHYIPPDQLYAFEFLIYYLQAFSLRRSTGTLPAKIPKQKVFDFFRKNISLPLTFN